MPRPSPAWLPPVWVFVAGTVVLVAVSVGGYVAGTHWNPTAESTENPDTAAQAVNSPEEDPEEEDEDEVEEDDEDDDEEDEDEGDDHPAGIDPEVFYVLDNAKKDLAVDVAGNAMHNNAPVIGYERHGQENQQFRFVPVTEDYFEIVSRASGKSLQVGGGEDLDDDEIAQLTSTGAGNQHWAVIEAEGDTVRFVNRATGEALKPSSDGDPLKQDKDKPDKEELRWHLIPVE
jgi:hypothetical protein